MTELSRRIARWVEAGVIDPEAAVRIRAFEDAESGPARGGWLVRAALVFGSVLLGAGILLFIAAHWDRMSPAARFTLVLATVGLIHAAAAAVSSRTPALATALHAVGTVALGGGIFLAGQIFNLEAHWPSGVLLWAIGAAAGWWLRRDRPQLALLALLVPVWLQSEWMWRVEPTGDWQTAARVAAAGSVLTAIAYLAALGRDVTGGPRRVLSFIGAVALLPAALALAATTSGIPSSQIPMSTALQTIGWTVAIAGPIGLSVLLRGRDAWPQAIAAGWTVVLVWIAGSLDAGSIPVYAWWAIGAIGLVAWGVQDHRLERINLGFVLFAATVLVFYFSTVMTRLGRSASLITLGLLFLAGGWALERSRRQLVQSVKGAR
jgi:uncharacterized membrane protein